METSSRAAARDASRVQAKGPPVHLLRRRAALRVASGAALGAAARWVCLRASPGKRRVLAALRPRELPTAERGSRTRRWAGRAIEPGRAQLEATALAPPRPAS